MSKQRDPTTASAAAKKRPGRPPAQVTPEDVIRRRDSTGPRAAKGDDDVMSQPPGRPWATLPDAAGAGALNGGRPQKS
jgi:hypothetical protein